MMLLATFALVQILQGTDTRVVPLLHGYETLDACLGAATLATHQQSRSTFDVSTGSSFSTSGGDITVSAQPEPVFTCGPDAAPAPAPSCVCDTDGNGELRSDEVQAYITAHPECSQTCMDQFTGATQ